MLDYAIVGKTNNESDNHEELIAFLQTCSYLPEFAFAFLFLMLAYLFLFTRILHGLFRSPTLVSF